MNYEQKYKSALEWMCSIYPTMQGAEKEDAEHYFPELRESKDERIRKAILELVRQSSEVLDRQNQNNMITWLEKQGEQKPVKSEQNCYHNDGLYYAIDILEKTFGKVEGYQSDDGKMEHQTAIETVNALYHKKPNHWKPSEEQMEAIKYFIDFHRPQANASTEGWKEFENLERLYNNLLKL